MERNYSAFLERKKRDYGDKFDASDLNPAFIYAYESGKRVEVSFRRRNGDVWQEAYKKIGTIGVTTGWYPCFLLMLRRMSTGSVHIIGMHDVILRTMPTRKRR